MKNKGLITKLIKHKIEVRSANFLTAILADYDADIDAHKLLLQTFEKITELLLSSNIAPNELIAVINNAK